MAGGRSVPMMATFHRLAARRGTQNVVVPGERVGLHWAISATRHTRLHRHGCGWLPLPTTRPYRGVTTGEVQDWSYKYGPSCGGRVVTVVSFACFCKRIHGFLESEKVVGKCKTGVGTCRAGPRPDASRSDAKGRHRILRHDPHCPAHANLAAFPPPPTPSRAPLRRPARP